MNPKSILTIKDLHYLLSNWDMLPKNEELKVKLVAAYERRDQFEWFTARENESLSLINFIDIPVHLHQISIIEFLDRYHPSGKIGTNRTIAQCFERKDLYTMDSVLGMALRKIATLRNLGLKKRTTLFETMLKSQKESEDVNG